MRNSFLLALVALLCGGAARTPNILFILSDDQRPDTIAALGNPVVQTPHLDRLCARGTAFTRAHIMGGMQGAVCVPSRAAILTGRTIFHCPDQPVDLPVWPATFAGAGYTTFQTGKWHNGPTALNHAFQSSKSTFFGGMNDHAKIPLQDYDPTGKYPKARTRVGDKYDAEIFADAAVEFLAAQERADKPWFLWVSFTNPHDPRTPPAEYAKRYDPATIPLPPNWRATVPVEPGVLGIRDEKLLPYPRDPAAVRKEIAAYYATITHLDAQIGRILDALQATGQADNTLVIFAGDNGLALGSHGLLGKQNVYEHSLGVPLIVAGPGVRAGAKTAAMVYLLDLFPTTCALADIPVPPTVEGRSFAAVLRGQSDTARTTLFGAYTKLHRSVRDDRWKLIEWTVGGRRSVQPFDLQNDPAETTDLSQDPRHAGERTRLERLLAEQKKDLDDPT